MSIPSLPFELLGLIADFLDRVSLIRLSRRFADDEGLWRTAVRRNGAGLCPPEVINRFPAMRDVLPTVIKDVEDATAVSLHSGDKYLVVSGYCTISVFNKEGVLVSRLRGCYEGDFDDKRIVASNVMDIDSNRYIYSMPDLKLLVPTPYKRHVNESQQSLQLFGVDGLAQLRWMSAEGWSIHDLGPRRSRYDVPSAWKNVHHLCGMQNGCAFTVTSRMVILNTYLEIINVVDNRMDLIRSVGDRILKSTTCYSIDGDVLFRLDRNEVTVLSFNTHRYVYMLTKNSNVYIYDNRTKEAFITGIEVEAAVVDNTIFYRNGSQLMMLPITPNMTKATLFN